MPRRPRPIHAEVVWGDGDPEIGLQEWVDATMILMRARERCEERLAVNGGDPIQCQTATGGCQMSASRRFNSEDRGRKIVLRNEETGATVGFTCFELCELTMAVNAAREMIELAVNQELADRFQQLVGGSVEDWWRSEPPIQKENVSMEQIVIRLARPEVGVEYRPESPEAEPADQLAALELALHALAQRVQQLRVTLGMPCPPEVERLVASDLWRRGL